MEIPHMTTPYLPLCSQDYPYTQNVQGHASFGDEVDSLKSMLGTIMAKLSSFDSTEATVEQIKTESAQVKMETEAMKSELKEIKNKNKA